MSSRTGLCQHCGEPYAPLTADGYIDRHHRADWQPDRDPGNVLCFGSAMGGGHLRPGELCRHTVPAPSCRSAGAAAGGEG